MRCPFCGDENTIVKDSRPTDDGAAIKRRRSCSVCDSRFNTFERVQLQELMVLKRNGEKKPFDRNKIERSILTALRKRDAKREDVEMMINKIVRKFETSGEVEIKTENIGNEIMNELSKLDIVAYIRFSSVYKDFSNAQDFKDFLDTIKNAN